MLGNGAGKGFGFGLGFNLIGLLVVIAILGVAAALSVSALDGGTTGLTAGTVSGLTATTAAGTKTPTATGATTPTGTLATGRPTTGTPTTAAPAGTTAVGRAAAVATCNSDASEVETAVMAYAVGHGSAVGVTPALLSSYLQAFPSSPDFSISIVSGVVMVAAPKTATPVPYDAPGACAQAGA
jgi:hypothetical protein